MEENGISINKFLREEGVCSRREEDSQEELRNKLSSRQRMRQFLLCGRNEVRDVFKKFGGTWL